MKISTELMVTAEEKRLCNMFLLSWYHLIPEDQIANYFVSHLDYQLSVSVQ